MQAGFTATLSVITSMRHQFATRATHATHATHAARCVAALITAILLSFSGAARADLAAERQVLIDLYNSTGGANWDPVVRASWRNAADTDFKDVSTVCTQPWQGVQCDGGGTTILSLALSAKNLVGTVPASIANLTSLEDLVLDTNTLSGSLSVFAAIPALKALYLDRNAYSGSIPSDLFSKAPLTTVILASNQLTGSIPDWSGMTNMGLLNLSGNSLSGTIPPIAALSRLRTLVLSNNRLTGSIPPLANLTLLDVFFADNNRLTGTIPPLTGMTALLAFVVNDNQLTGSLPELVVVVPNLKTLRVRNNQLTGPLPNAPTGLFPNDSTLCPNQLTYDAANTALNTPWNAAVGTTGTNAWNVNCVAPRSEQTLRFDVIPTLLVGGSGTAVASAMPLPNSAAPVQYSTSSASVCAVDADTGSITVLPAAVVGSTCIVVANKAGDTTANSAQQIQQNIPIQAAMPNSTVAAPVSMLNQWALLAMALTIVLTGVTASTRQR
jgi:hypothetical protein